MRMGVRIMQLEAKRRSTAAAGLQAVALPRGAAQSSILKYTRLWDTSSLLLSSNNRRSAPTATTSSGTAARYSSLQCLRVVYISHLSSHPTVLSLTTLLCLMLRSSLSLSLSLCVCVRERYNFTDVDGFWSDFMNKIKRLDFDQSHAQELDGPGAMQRGFLMLDWPTCMLLILADADVRHHGDWRRFLYLCRPLEHHHPSQCCALLLRWFNLAKTVQICAT